MPVWKQLLLSLYYHGTYPRRTRDSARRAATGRAPIIVLFYHRIADVNVNRWTTTNAMFARQMSWLQQRFDMVTLAEAQGRMRSGQNTRPAISVTFDDGYAENCDRALPLLIERGIPCTYFVATRHVIEQRPFEHDLAAGSSLAPNTVEQIRALAAAGIEMGAHTRRHANLGAITDSAKLYDELVGGREELADMTGVPVRYFAFPYGQHVNMTGAAFELARQSGFDGVCSAYGGFNFPGDDAFHIQRVHVDNDLIRLKNWVTVDPRKLRKTLRFEYTQTAAGLAGAAV